MTTATIPNEAVLQEALLGLTTTPQKTLPPWLFYDELGSQLFEQITTLPEYYLTRTERALFAAHADDILRTLSAPHSGLTPVSGGQGGAAGFSPGFTIAELGAGTASKTGLLLRAATRFQPEVLYQPIDVSPTALDEAAATLTATIPNLTVRPQLANYITDRYTLIRPDSPEQNDSLEQNGRPEQGGLPHRILALYIGSSIGNFSPAEATSILRNLRHHLIPGDTLLLGADLAPGPHKSIATLLAAYDDAAGITAAFNKNILTRLNRDLDADFDLTAFAHRARWNAPESRIEMHLESLIPQTIHIADKGIHLAKGETIHTENSYKFTDASLTALLTASGFTPTRTFHDPAHSFAVTLAQAL